MAAIPTGIIVAWPSTAASIPSGWTRVTELDSRYIVGAATGASSDLSTDNGAATHTHTSPSHTPAADVHNHVFAASASGASPLQASTTGASTFVAAAVHGHSDEAATDATAVNDGVAITIDATANDLTFVTVIWIKSDGTPTQFPSGCIAWFESDTLPTNWSRVHGNRYLKGAAAAGDGGSTGGANTHTHTSPAHTHTQQPHSHTAAQSQTPDTFVRRNTVLVVAVASTVHVHQVSGAAATATNQSVTTTLSTDNHEPPYKKLNNIQSSAATVPVNLVMLWSGTHANIPLGWSRYTALDSTWLKGANVNGESGVSSGGSATHTHTASDCQPIQNAHTHTAVDEGSAGSINALNTGVTNFVAAAHTHSTWTFTTDAATNAAASVTIDAAAALPPYRTLIYVRLDTVPIPDQPVTVHISGATSYDIGRFDIGSPDARILPEAAKKIAQGDLRFVPH